MHERFSARIIVSFLLFVAAGTLVLVLALNAAFQRYSHDEFLALARANAEFLRTLHLARTERIADYLSQMLGVKVELSRASAPDAHHEAVTVNVESGLDLTLIRERPTVRALLLRPVTILALAAFWALWFGLAWAVVRPYVQAQRLAVLGQMAASLAHQIRNPIAAIRLHGQLLEKSQPEAASLIVDEATHIEGLLNQWMFLARPEPPRKTEVNLGDLLRQTVRLLAPAADHAQVRVVLNLEGAATLPADGRRLTQVFHNLIINAIQAMPTGGRLTISSKNRSICFADTGPGFSPAALKHWADMLYSEKEGGMGIGLSVAREIIRAHGGRLTVGNQPGGGAIVRIEL